ncbi:MAG: TlpA family protein disulfide reductase [Promethearchaeota archaeon]
MTGSKFQNRAKTNIKQKKTKQRVRYYDEKISKNKSKSYGPAIFIGLIVILAGSIWGIGSLIQNSANSPGANDTQQSNPYYTSTSTTTTTEVISGYQTPLTLTTITGDSIKLADYSGKVVILYFHYLACSACKTFDPYLNYAVNQYTSDQVITIAITVNPSDTVAQLTTWAEDGGYTWSQVRDTDYSLAANPKFTAQYTPTTVYLDKNGNVGVRHVGAQAANDIMENINSLL